MTHFFYYLKMLIQILFDHDSKLQDFNLKQAGELSKKPVIEKNMRFSFRNREEMESYLTDSVRSKLDFFKQLEDVTVPGLFRRNISFVMTLGGRLLHMIDGIISLAGTAGAMSEQQQQTEAFKGWMKRFIVTNYEIYIDYFQGHAEFVAQQYFSLALSSMLNAEDSP